MSEPTTEAFLNWLKAFQVDADHKPPVKAVRLEPGEEGYHEFKLLDEDGKIRGYCGQAYLDAVERYASSVRTKAQSQFDTDYPPHPIFQPLPDTIDETSIEITSRGERHFVISPKQLDSAVNPQHT